MTTLTAPTPTAGGTELLSYRGYRGKLGGPLRGTWAIARSGLWTILRRKMFWGLYTFALLIFLFFFFGQYLMSWVSTQLGEGPILLNQSTRIRIEPAELLVGRQEVAGRRLRGRRKLGGGAQTRVELSRRELDVVAVALVPEEDIERDDAPVRETVRSFGEIGGGVEDDRGVLRSEIHR